MSVFKNEYEVEEISFSELEHLMATQKKESTQREKKLKEASEQQKLNDSDTINEKISESAKSDTPDWILASRF